MLDMIKALYHGDLDAMEMSVKPDSEYSRVAQKVSEFCDSLSGKEGIDQEQVFQILSDYEDKISYTYFSLGLRWGAQLMLALLQDKDDIFLSREPEKDS